MDRNASNDQQQQRTDSLDIVFLSFYCCCLQEDMLCREISWAAYWPITGGLLCPIALLLNCGRGAQGQAQPMKAN